MREVNSLGDLLLSQAESAGERVALLRTVGQRIEQRGWGRVVARAWTFTEVLRESGLRQGDCVALVGLPGYEYLVAMFGAWLGGMVPVPIHHTCTGPELKEILSGASVKLAVFDGPLQLRKVRGCALAFPIVLIKDSEILDAADERGRSFLRFQDLEECEDIDVSFFQDLMGDEDSSARIPEHIPEIKPGDPAAVVHTTDVDGRYKGAVLTHQGLLFQGERIAERLGVRPDDQQLLVLPLSHVLGLVSLTTAMQAGAGTVLGGGFRSLVEDMTRFNPSFVVGVPRMYEKLVQRIRASVQEFGTLWRTLFRVGLEASTERSRRGDRPGDGGDLLGELEHRLADRLVFPRVRTVFGNRLRFFVSGGAPLSRGIIDFITALGCPLYEGYGLTEAGGATHLNGPGVFEPGTVGPPLPGVGVRVTNDGEILVRSPSLMSEYFGDSSSTSRMIVDGWLHTGDIGNLGRRGHLRVTGRKRQLLVTAVGKNIAPAKIEAALKTIPLVNRVVVFGDRRSHLVALITLDEAKVSDWGQARGLRFEDLQTMARNLDVYSHLEKEVERVDLSLAPPERVRRFAILNRQLSQEGGELDSLFKVRRSRIEKTYRNVLDTLYEEEA